MTGSGFRTALELVKSDPEQRPRDNLQAITSEGEHKLEAANEEIARLNEELAQRDEKIKAMAEEIRQLRQREATFDFKDLFNLLESFSMNSLGPVLDHQAVDKESRDLARTLRSKPDELRHYLNKGSKTHLEACEELEPLLEAATKKLSGTRKPGASEGKDDHRARLLLEKLELRGEIRTVQAIDIIDGDEGVRPDNTVVCRAMKKAARMRPDKAVFIKSFAGGIGSVLRRC